MVKLIRRIAIFAACAGVLGCASAPPAQRTAGDKDYLAQQRAATDVAKLVILADACVIRDVVGDDLIRRDASEGMPLKAALTLRTLLADRGSNVVSSTAYTVCAATDASVDKMPWTERWNAPKQAPPGPWLESRDENEAATAALQRAVRNRVENATGGYALRSLGLPADTLDALRKSTNAQRAWVVQLAGIDVGGGKQVSQGLWYSLLALPVTLAEGVGGSNDSSIWRGGIDSDLQRYTLALVDLEAGQLVWWKASGWTGTGTNFGAAYDAEWVLRATRPLYR